MQDKELTFWTTSPNKFLVATDSTSGRVLGCISYRKIAEDTVEMHRLSVDPNCRGLGLGQKLVQELLRTAKQNGFTSMYLETSFAQKSAIKLYERMGFQFVRVCNAKPGFWLLGFLMDNFTAFAVFAYMKQI